ncbi:hypothetical protein G647_09467 [Cladophialophora carrionii CBS 160.54]|uniref:SGF29 C-terminal domain-containing protein n=1 Tax=Cladophialophora carrionii CBS 160.54 TaxID=1279043 RepID=V9D028_9EURO|nr:uncharacterized protein G647_09467 [Cladophialophora carrionii CBS 160.54]ETI19633.1 hypothetical protein G647_09467 [Cladophialophora carrionii CBS 160.54]
MSSRPRAGRGTTGRDGTEVLENDLLNRTLESLRKVKEYNDKQKDLGDDIMALEGEMKANGRTSDQLQRLDQLYREMLRYAELERKVQEEEDFISNLAILKTLKTSDEPAPRNGQSKVRKQQRSNIDPDAVDSPGPSPGDGRSELMKRVKGTSQRSSSTASQNRAPSAIRDDSVETNVGLQAERTGQLKPEVEVFYKYPDLKIPKDTKDQKAQDELEGVGIHVIIKKVLQDRKPVQYDVRDPEVDASSGKPTSRRVLAKNLLPIPKDNPTFQYFKDGTSVYAKYPYTDTFYKATVQSFKKPNYSLSFDDDDQGLQTVEGRFVFENKDNKDNKPKDSKPKN